MKIGGMKLSHTGMNGSTMLRFSYTKFCISVEVVNELEELIIMPECCNQKTSEVGSLRNSQCMWRRVQLD